MYFLNIYVVIIFLKKSKKKYFLKLLNINVKIYRDKINLIKSHVYQVLKFLHVFFFSEISKKIAKFIE